MSVDVANSYIVFDQVSFSYDTHLILKDISFTVNNGERLAILGANGSGKSTLMKLLAGLEAPQSGIIQIENVHIGEKNTQFLREKCGIVFQNPNDQFVGSTVIDDIAFGLENHQVSHDQMDARIQRTLKQFDLEGFANLDPASLSGGQKQRAAIAAVSVLNPDVLIFDESTSMLDPKHRSLFFEMVDQMKMMNSAQIQMMITHDLNEILYFDRVIVLGDQHIVFDDHLDAFLAVDEKTLEKWNLDVPYALKVARTLSENIDEVKQHYFEILKRTRV